MLHWKADRLHYSHVNVRIWHGCVHCFILKTLLMEDKEETRGKLILYVLWLLRVSFFLYCLYGGGSQRAEEGFTRWSTGGESFSVARCPPYSTCTTCTRPVFDSLHYWTACSLNILTCFRRNSARLTFSMSVLNQRSAKLAKLQKSW